ncbi:MAG: hypothetical protein LUD14_03245 [Clostridiales bacterium]|nr:hypothetical protein [Clostridiales bacterium]
MYKLDELGEFLERLAKNEETVGAQALRAKKYKKSYMNLKKQIADTASEAFSAITASYLYLQGDSSAALENVDDGIYNDLIDAWLIDGTWYKDDHTFLSAPPADHSSFEMEYALEMEAYGKGMGKEEEKHAA